MRAIGPESDTSTALVADELISPPSVVVTVIRPALLDKSVLLDGSAGSSAGQASWEPGRAPWAQLWPENIRQAGDLAHQARPPKGVARILIGQSTDWSDLPDVHEDFVVHRQIPSYQGNPTYFDEIGLTAWGVTFLSVSHCGPRSMTTPEHGWLNGWLIAHFIANWPDDAGDIDLDSLRKALDVANVPQPVTEDGPSIDCLGHLITAHLPDAGLRLDATEDPFSRVLVLARAPEGRDEIKAAERQERGSGQVTKFSNTLGRQQGLYGLRLEESGSIGNLSWDYRALVASSHRLVHVIPSRGDDNGVVSHFVDIYPAFLLATIQDVGLNQFATDLQDEGYFSESTLDTDEFRRESGWTELLNSQADFYAFRSKFWWVQWARRGPGVHLLPRLQDLWGTEKLARQLGDEYRDYGNAASAELARLLIRQDQKQQERERKWRSLAKMASIIVGGLTLLGVWAGLAALSLSRTDSDASGVTWSFAIIVTFTALLLLLAGWIADVSDDSSGTHRKTRRTTHVVGVRVLLLVAAVVPVIVLLLDLPRATSNITISLSLVLVLLALILWSPREDAE